MRAHTIPTVTALLVALAVSAGAAGAAGADLAWPQWRGPGASGVAAQGDVPLDWGVERNVLWKTPLPGRGHSSPVVWGDRVYLTTAIEGELIPDARAPLHHLEGEEFRHPDSVGADHAQTLQVLAVDVDSGEVVWTQTAYAGRVFDDRHRVGSYASPSVATDGETVLAYFGAEGLYAYGVDGELRWRKDLGKIRSEGLGVGSSPVLAGDLVIVQADEDEGERSFIAALDKTTGAEAWRVPRPVQASWTTPVLASDSKGRLQLVTSGNELIVSYDPATGEELWRATGLESHAIHVPLAGDGRVIVTSGYPAKVIKAFSLDARGDLTGKDDAALWTYRKGTAYVPSNLLYDGYLYLTNDSGVLTCLDPATGEVVYEGGRGRAGGPFMASLVAANGRILMIDRDGDADIVRAGPRYELLAATSIDEPVYATPAIVGSRLYIRSEHHLWAIGAAGS